MDVCHLYIFFPGLLAIVGFDLFSPFLSFYWGLEVGKAIDAYDQFAIFN